MKRLSIQQALCFAVTWNIVTLVVYLSLSTVVEDNSKDINLYLMQYVDKSHQAITNETVSGTTVITGASNPKVWLVGMIINYNKMQLEVKKSLISLNCNHNVGIHILFSNEESVKDAKKAYDRMKMPQEKCAPFILQHENQWDIDRISKRKPLKRIDRISKLRDLQRLMLKDSVYSHEMSRNDERVRTDNASIVILADLDMRSLPNINAIMQQTSQLQNSSYPNDIICALGIIKNKKSKKNYYDTFATVFLPDTFAHSYERRMILPNDRRMILPHLTKEDRQYLKMNTEDMHEYFIGGGDSGEEGAPTRVRSCFGGMAIYRAHTYFEPKCRYQLVKQDKDRMDGFHKTKYHGPKKFANLRNHTDLNLDIMRYANLKESRPCEHVVFHECLRSANDDTLHIAVNPLLIADYGRFTDFRP